MAKYKPIPKQKRASTSAAKKGPRVMSGADKVRMIRIVKLQPKSDVPQPPQNAQAKRGLSIARILDATTADALNFGREIVIESAKKFRTGKGLPAVTSKSWHRDPLRHRALVQFRQQRALRVERLVTHPVGAGYHRMHDHRSSIDGAGGVGAQNHRHAAWWQPDPGQ